MTELPQYGHAPLRALDPRNGPMNGIRNPARMIGIPKIMPTPVRQSKAAKRMQHAATMPPASHPANAPCPLALEA